MRKEFKNFYSVGRRKCLKLNIFRVMTVTAQQQACQRHEASVLIPHDTLVLQRNAVLSSCGKCQRWQSTDESLLRCRRKSNGPFRPACFVMRLERKRTDCQSIHDGFQPVSKAVDPKGKVAAIPLVGFCCHHVFAGGRREQPFHVNARLGDGSLSAMPIKPRS